VSIQVKIKFNLTFMGWTRSGGINLQSQVLGRQRKKDCETEVAWAKVARSKEQNTKTKKSRARCQ
jgi:hypothetical protein